MSWLACLLLSAAIVSCEHINLDNDTKSGGTATTDLSAPTTTGQGTAEAPYTIQQLKAGADTLLNQQVWVIGYAVGEAYQSMSNAVFASPFTHGSNLLLAEDSLCTNTAACIPIELNTTSAKNGLSLLCNPTCHHQCLMLQGTVSTYLRTTGLRSVSAYKWLGAFSIPTNNPTEWDEDSI